MSSSEAAASSELYRRKEIVEAASLAVLPQEVLCSLLSEFAAANEELADRIDAELTRAAEQRWASGVDSSAEQEPYMVGSSPAMLQTYDRIRRFAKTDAPVLITGESGTGKELAALAIHERSARAPGSFAAINCAGLPTTLITSELFGYEKGAFTGATRRHIGRIEAANGGTVFLDEIGDLPLELQPHLLRFLQEQTIERLGSTRPVKVDVRIIAATNQDLESLIAEDKFREDLYFRLKVLSLRMPPLRERGEDIGLLASFFLKKFHQELQIHEADLALSEDAVEAIREFEWPGNVRELISRVREAVIMSDSATITAENLNLPKRGASADNLLAASAELVSKGGAARPEPPQSGVTLEDARARIEVDLIRAALDRNGSNVSRTASELGVSRVTLYRLMEKHGVRTDDSD